MTICVAALYGNGEGAVLASDQMVTAHIPFGYEFQHQETAKIVPLDEGGKTYALTAGDVLSGTEILKLATEQIRQQPDSSASEIANVIRSAYQFFRVQQITQKEIEPRGMTLDQYYASHQSLMPTVVQMIDSALLETDIDVDIIVVGPSAEGYTIHTITNPGIVHDHSPIGYCAIGSGAPHAMYSLIESSYSRSNGVDSVKEIVQRAKVRSEVAPGVGEKTELKII